MADVIIQTTSSNLAPHVNLATHLIPQVEQKSLNSLTNLITQMPKKRIIADVRTVQNADGTSLLQMDKIKEKKSLSSRAVTILRTTELGETVAALGSCAYGIYSIFTGNLTVGYSSVAAGTGVLWKLVESRIVDWMKK